MHDKLHWLPFPERVEFKLCSIVYKCLHDSAHRYLSHYCIPVASLPGRSHMRSAASGDLFVPATSTKTILREDCIHYYIIIIILVLHLRLSSKLPQRRMRLCSVLEKFSFKQFFEHRKSYIRVLQTRRETVPSCWSSMKESTRANCLGGGGWHKQVTGRRRSQV